MSIINKCPGLKSESGYKWWVPFGKNTQEITLCNECKLSLEDIDDYTVSGVLYACNCDGFLLNNKVDNGIFNVSFWHVNQTRYYSAERLENGELHLTMPLGETFHLFINANLKMNQYFQYEILIDDTIVEKNTSEKHLFFKQSVLDSGGYTAIPSTYNIQLLQPVKNRLITEATKLVVRLDVFTLESPKSDTGSNQFYGDYTMIDHKTLGVKANAVHSSHLNLICPEYKNRVPLIGQGTMAKFTKNPIVFSFRVGTVPGQPQVVKEVMKKILVSAQKTAEKNLEKNQKDHLVYTNLLAESESYTLTLKQKLDEINAQLGL
jgi:hypothetical protein